MHHRERRRLLVRRAGRGLRREVRRPDPLRHQGRRSRPRRAPRSPRWRARARRGSTSSARRSSSRRRSRAQLRALRHASARWAARTRSRNAIAFARYRDGEFGWGVVDPGHGMVFTRAGRPLDAAAAAPLSGIGQLRAAAPARRRATALPRRCSSQLLDTQPAYRTDPVAGVYNHGWIIGDDGRDLGRGAGAHRRPAGDRPGAASG